MDAFDQQEKNPAIWEFLTTWAQMCKEWYKKNAEKYYQLSLTYEEDLARAEATWKEQHPNEKSWTAYIWKEKYEATYFRTINALTKSLTKIVRNYREEGYPITGYELDEAKLDRVLEEEKNRKYKELLDRVTEVVGTITDASNLTIGNQNGEINGFVIGHEGKCSVETISAGGYNIQCFHYRVLVKPIR